VSGSYDKTARVWDVKTGKELKILQAEDKVQAYYFFVI